VGVDKDDVLDLGGSDYVTISALVVRIGACEGHHGTIGEVRVASYKLKVDRVWAHHPALPAARNAISADRRKRRRKKTIKH
jgi:hypothetical protein